MMNHLRLSGLYERLPLLRIMGRISHFTLWNLLMKVLHVLPLETTRLLLTPQELLGRIFLMDTQEDGQRFRAHIVECISDHESNVRRSDDHVKFRISVNEDEYEETIAYNELLDFIEKNQENDAIVWQFRRIVGHQGPFLQHDKDYNGSRFIEWENGEITTEPLSVIAADDPITCAVYAREHELLDVEGWKRFRNLAKREKISYVSLNKPR
jgi:hypothetical protein